MLKTYLRMLLIKDSHGRTSRSEYFTFLIPSMVLVMGGLGICGYFIGRHPKMWNLVGFFAFIVLALLLAYKISQLTKRRYHDIGLGDELVRRHMHHSITLLYYCAKKGDPEPNAYGPSPSQKP